MSKELRSHTIRRTARTAMTSEYFEKPPKTSRYAPKVYKEWDGKRGKSKSSSMCTMMRS
jgi:hypothetical protein